MIAALATLIAFACPVPADVEGMEIYLVERGCEAPTDGWVYTRAAYAQNAAELAGLSVLVRRAREDRDQCRSDWSIDSKNAAGLIAAQQVENDGLRTELQRVPDPPSRLVWAGVGATLAVVAAWVVVGL